MHMQSCAPTQRSCAISGHKAPCPVRTPGVSWRQLALWRGHWDLRGFGMWALEERASRAFVGRVGLHYPEGWPDREVGWTLARTF